MPPGKRVVPDRGRRPSPDALAAAEGKTVVRHLTPEQADWLAHYDAMAAGQVSRVEAHTDGRGNVVVDVTRRHRLSG